MFVFGADFFLVRPGALLFAAGLVLLLALTGRASRGRRFRLSTNFMLLGFGLAILGQSMLFSAGLAKILFDYSGQVGPRFQPLFSHNRTIAFCLIAGLGADGGGDAPGSPLPEPTAMSCPAASGWKHSWAIFGVWLIIAAFQTFIFALMIRALGAMLPDPNRGDAA